VQLDFPPASFDVLTCSSSLAFLTSVPATLAAWHVLLKQPRGRLALNTFVAPALLDYATVKQVAAEWGLAISDPFEVVGNEQLLRELLLGAGFSTVKVRRPCWGWWRLLIMTTTVLPQLENVLLASCSAWGVLPVVVARHSRSERRTNMQRQGQLGGALINCLGASPA
jgi:ubiquinone/menaquinone biosynthesis C-methylase UbiE